jgi:hypothetical protein
MGNSGNARQYPRVMDLSFTAQSEIRLFTLPSSLENKQVILL